MGRFSNLEFESAGEEHREERAEEPLRDERHYLGLAVDRFHEGRFEEALRYYSRALEFDAQLAEAWLGQVQALLELDEPHEARVWADKGLEQFRNHAEMLAAKGVATARLGDPDTALALSDAALAEKGTSAYRWRARGDVLLSRRDRNVDFCFEKAVAEAPRDWFEPLAVGRVYMYYGRYAPALRHLENALARNASSAFVWESLARCLEKLALSARATQAYQHALDLDATRAEAKEGLARMEGRGLFAEAVSRVRAWLRGRRGEGGR
ncbi:MAG: tetratricopeptide repeat protein [Planctomycetes bacterium]|nr:tetratricopeptide repeat protein [Planctomycetota bacterium]